MNEILEKAQLELKQVVKKRKIKLEKHIKEMLKWAEYM